MAVEVKVTDNSKEFLEAFEKQIGLALNVVGTVAEVYAQKDCPVDTGRLRNSITHATETYSGIGEYKDKNGKAYSDAKALGTPEKYVLYIGTNVEYAQYVEFDDKPHHASGKAHFLRDAASKHHDKYKQIIKEALRE